MRHGTSGRSHARKTRRPKHSGKRFCGLGAAALATSLVALKRRLSLSKAKHASLDGHGRIARRIASFVPFYEYDESRFFCSDQAPAEIVARRRDGFMRLSRLYAARFRETNRRTAEVISAISDLQFTEAYRVPFQYSRFVHQHLKTGAFVQSSEGVMVADLDGNRFYDLIGSYVRELGPVLGPRRLYARLFKMRPIP